MKVCECRKTLYSAKFEFVEFIICNCIHNNIIWPNFDLVWFFKITCHQTCCTKKLICNWFAKINKKNWYAIDIQDLEKCVSNLINILLEIFSAADFCRISEKPSIDCIFIIQYWLYKWHQLNYQILIRTWLCHCKHCYQNPNFREKNNNYFLMNLRRIS